MNPLYVTEISFNEVGRLHCDIKLSVQCGSEGIRTVQVPLTFLNMGNFFFIVLEDVGGWYNAGQTSLYG